MAETPSKAALPERTPVRRGRDGGDAGAAGPRRVKASAEALLPGGLDVLPDPVALLGPDRRILKVNPALAKCLGVPEAEVLGRPCFEVFHGTGEAPAACPLTQTERDRCAHTAEVRVERLGEACEVTTAPILDGRGRLQGSVHLVRELADRRARERGLQQVNRMVQALSRSSQAMARVKDETEYLRKVCRIVVEECGCTMAWIGYRIPGRAKLVRPMAWAGKEEGYLATERILWSDGPRGRGPTGTSIRTGEAVLQRNLEDEPDFGPWKASALARGYRSSLALPLRGERGVFGALTVYATDPEAFSEGQVRILGELAGDLARGIHFLRLQASERRAQEALKRSSRELARLNDELEHRVQERTGELVRANAELTARILDRDRALEALRESEELLRHSQKMEAIGTLAGGVAHDFNNLLQVISGYSEILLDRLPEDHPLRAGVETIQRAGRKGSALTRQLLAFSRRQVLAPEILDLNQLLREMEKFFQRVLKEDIRLAFDLEPGIAAILADPGQLEQVIMNLVVNARDAMPGGGSLTLATRSAEDTVVLTVADTGRGMDAALLGRIFEPFFTTKAPGSGTGLGLATALGIVEQSGGTLKVRSEVGRGTVFTVTLPRARAGAAAPAQAREAPLPGGTETILLAEDDDEVRELTRHHLEASGYEVLDAHDAREALEKLGSGRGKVRLLLTDVVMPDLGGKDLAGAVQAQDPAIRVVFMSGYPDDVLGAQGGGWKGRTLISKPFDRARLLSAVRAALDSGG